MDYALALRYVAALAGPDDITVQTFDDTPQKRPRLAQIRGGNLPTLWPWIESQQAQQAGVFCTVNATHTGRRRARDVVEVRALFIDLDGKPPDHPWHRPPSILVQSARGLHAYWLVDQVPLEAFRSLQQRLIAYYGSDPAIHDLPRVLRLPGTVHFKATPTLVTLLSCHGTVYDGATVLDGVPELPLPPPRPPVPTRRRVVGGEADLSTFDALAFFAAAGGYLRDMGGGKHAVVCPWVGTHSEGPGSESSTVIFVGDRWPKFVCKHAHCDGKRMDDVVATLGAGTLAAFCSVRPSRYATTAAERIARYEARP